VIRLRETHSPIYAQGEAARITPLHHPVLIAPALFRKVRSPK
jgi:hypothetical protein